MIRKTLWMLVASVLVICILSFAFARGAPTKQKASASNAIVTEQVACVANLVPVMTGYDVIQNISESRDLSIAQYRFDAVTTVGRRQSPTRDVRNSSSVPETRARNGTP